MIVMPNSRRGENRNGAVATSDAMTAALAIRLRSAASFREKLRQLVVNCVTKKAPASGRFRMFLICRVRGKF
jgi:hypothetical protein